jgi:hypothetical protein
MLASVQDVENPSLLTRPSPSRQDAPFPGLRSQSFDVPIKYASSFKFPAALLDDHFEHPENSTPIASDGSLGAVVSLIHP